MTKKHFSILYLLFFCVCTTGTGYYLQSLVTKNFALWQYRSEFLQSASIFSKLINYSKDILILVMFIVVLVKIIRIGEVKRELLIAPAVVLIGSVIALLNGLSIMFIVCGVRAYIYAFTIYLYLKYYEIPEDFILNFSKLCKFIILLQLLSLIVVIIRSGFSILPGVGGNRLPGLFTLAGNLGSFSLGAMLIISHEYLNEEKKQNLIYIFWGLLSTILSIASGSRSTALYIVCLMLVVIISKINIGTYDKKIITPVMVLAGGILFLLIIIAYVNRGRLWESASGRFLSWENLLNLTPLQLFIGKGFGFATNTSTSSGLASVVTDNTFVTVTLQFGLLGLLLFCYGLIKFIKKLICNKNYYIWYLVYLSVLILALLFSGNTIELYCLIIPMIIVCYDIINNKNGKKA